jgi:hypothetical protein
MVTDLPSEAGDGKDGELKRQSEGSNLHNAFNITREEMCS